MKHILPDDNWLRIEYVDKGRSTVEIATELGCTPQAIQYRLRINGVKMRGRYYGRWKPKLCERCGAEFIPSGPAAKYCLEDQREPLTCEQCGQRFRSSWGALGTQRFCSVRCRGIASREPRLYTAQGYVRVCVGKDYPGARPDGRIFEHRYVMEQKLGRLLEDDETVHHINGQKADNRPENLQLRRGRHGKGSVLQCLDCGSHNVGTVPIADP